VTALVLAGGLGTRLRPRFGDLPKPLAPVGGRPFLARQLEWLRDHGIADVVLCVGAGAERIEQALGDGASLGVRLGYSRERKPLGTGGALALVRDRIAGPVLVVNGDTLPELDPWELERARWERGRVAAVALFRVDDAGALGRVECDAEGRVTRFVEKDPGRAGAAWASGGCYAFDRRLWEWIPEGPSSLERDVLPRLAAGGELHGHRVAGAFFDIGTPEGWERAERRFAS
jgi:NDP-sugar pyrophosphorylase family protein